MSTGLDIQPTTVRKHDLRKEISELRLIGAQMSNVCLNLAQRAKHSNDNVHLTADEARSFDKLRIKWDAIKRRETAQS